MDSKRGPSRKNSSKIKTKASRESRSDQTRLELYTAELGELGVAAEYDLGFGRPVEELARMTVQHRADFLVMGSHGHRGLGDLLHGTTVEALRHQLDIPVLVVPSRK